MPYFTFTRNIPDAPNNPSSDQPNMKDNNNSIQDFLAVDHFGFNDNNGGWHQQVTMPSFAAAFPATIAGQGALFVKTDSGGQQALWFVRDNIAGTLVQLTTSKIVAPLVAANGYTFLPGGLILQWGLKTGLMMGSGASNIVNFPIAFPTAGSPFSIIVQPIRIATTNVDTLYILNGSVSLSSFTINNTSSSINSAYFFAIGN